MDFSQLLKSRIDLINAKLDEYLVEHDNYQKKIYQAMRYSIFAGGKRLRPVMTLAACDIVGGDERLSLPFGCAVEMIHTYSLIHDDLPVMDNDDYRRGKPTNHKVFGQAMAVLAGDALLNKAFEIMAAEAVSGRCDIKRAVKAMLVIAEASGTEGMIGGQVVDIESGNYGINDLHKMEYMHLHKTGALIAASIEAGAIIGGAGEKELESLALFGRNVGLAFQIKDDLLDVEGDQQLLGKPVGSDENNKKSTFVTLMGIEKSKQRIEELTQEAIDSLGIFHDKGWFLIQLARELVGRNK
ncbi:MAG: polyprenyl synthetase family protein [Clostridiaceae bacterium]|nr:polyprenyl synthetase family protein [Clostridiaceae bacterium]